MLTQPSTPHKAQTPDRFAGELSTPQGKLNLISALCPSALAGSGRQWVQNSPRSAPLLGSHSGFAQVNSFQRCSQKLNFHNPTCEMGTGMALQCPQSVPWSCAGTGSPPGLTLCSVTTPLASHLPFWSFSSEVSPLLPAGCCSSRAVFPRGVPAAPHSVGMRGAGNPVRLSRVGSSLHGGFCPEVRREQLLEQKLPEPLQGTGTSSAFPSHPQERVGEPILSLLSIWLCQLEQNPGAKQIFPG